jgi:hypothetical protein
MSKITTYARSGTRATACSASRAEMGSSKVRAGPAVKAAMAATLRVRSARAAVAWRHCRSGKKAYMNTQMTRIGAEM